jgi:hypothetical protein
MQHEHNNSDPTGGIPFPHLTERDRNQRLRIAIEMSREAEQETAPRQPEQAPDTNDMAKQLRLLAQEIETRQADLVMLLAQFDTAQGWRASGAKHCVAWMNVELDICPSLARETLRVAHALIDLPQMTSLFRSGRLGWSKVRALTRVATADNEHALAATSLDMTAGDVVRMVSQYRWRRTLSDIDAENEADQIRHERRGLIWSRSGDGNTVFKLTLPPDTAAQFLRCIERAEEQLLDAEHETIETSRDTGTTEEALVRPTATQRRADAALAMAESSMTADASGNGPAERFQVVVNIDADVLAEDTAGSATPSCGCKAPLEVDLSLPVRAFIQGSGAVTAATAQRIACDSSLVTVISERGEPLSIGRKTRVWPEPMLRALRARDECCQFPGCTATRWLQAHHIVHWAHGGETSVNNGCMLCPDCHRRVHEQAWHITRLDEDGQGQTDNAFECESLLESAGEHETNVAEVLSRHRPRFRFARLPCLQTCCEDDGAT